MTGSRPSDIDHGDRTLESRKGVPREVPEEVSYDYPRFLLVGFSYFFTHHKNTESESLLYYSEDSIRKPVSSVFPDGSKLSFSKMKNYHVITPRSSRPQSFMTKV